MNGIEAPEFLYRIAQLAISLAAVGILHEIGHFGPIVVSNVSNFIKDRFFADTSLDNMRKFQ